VFHVKHNPCSDDFYKGILIERFKIPEDQIVRIDQYCSAIRRWSDRQNIVSRHDLDRLWDRHVIPSAFLSASIRNEQVEKIADVGSGTGFPGIIIKILQPSILITLIDSSRKKCLFLTETCDTLGIGCKVINDRIEKLGYNKNTPFDIIVSRGVASLELLWTWSERLITEYGSLWVLKGGNIDQEMEPLGKLNLKIKVIKPSYDWLDLGNAVKDKFIVCVRRTHGSG
jgi:16S rRNA (guanine527-N7)-methyltransferase